MKIIAIETSAEACSAALWVDGAAIERFEVAPRGHSELILPMIDAVLAEGGVVRADLDGVVFGRGPGSFTGVRIATGVAQGIGYALDLPVVPVSTLEILAQGVLRTQGATRVLAAFDARMNELYWAPCALGSEGLMRRVGDECVCAPESVPSPVGGGWCGAGSGWRTYGELLVARLVGVLSEVLPEAQCHAQDAAALGAVRLAAGGGVAAAEALPVYLRDRVAWKKG